MVWYPLAAWVAIFSLPLVGESATCLPNGIPLENRTDISINGISLPLYLARDNQPIIIRITTYIYLLIMQEVYGINTKFYWPGEFGIWYMAGCVCANLGCVVPTCKSPVPQFHAVVGMSTLTHKALNWLAKNMPERSPENVGSLGYEVTYQTVISDASLQYGIRNLSLPLDHYSSYALNENAFQAFSSPLDIPYERLYACNRSTFHYPEFQRYNRIFKDEGGGSLDADGNWNPTCHLDGFWWLAPACRHDPRRCVPFLTLNQHGLSMAYAMARSAVYGWPLAIAAPYKTDELQTLPLDFRMMWLITTPDEAYASIKPKEVAKPRYENVWGYEEVVGTNPMISNYFYNGWAGPIEGVLGFQAKETLRRLHLGMNMAADISRRFQELYVAAGRPAKIATTYKYAACEWLRGNEATWRKWLPLETECPLGQGLRDAGGGFVEARADAKSCEWCSLGRFSIPLRDDHGLTHLCKPCPAGQEQVTSGQWKCTACVPGRFKTSEGEDLCQDCPPGHATELEGQQGCTACAPGMVAGQPGALKCQACPEGTSAQKNGSLSCEFCSRASFAEAPGSETCTPCSDVILGSTSDRGAALSSDCVCPEGSYKVGQSCKACSEGLVCPGGNDEPLQASGYWVDVQDPQRRRARDYTIYLCRTTQECPGGLLGTCASGRHDTACNNCMDQHYPASGGECEPCQSSSALPIVAFVMGAVAVISVFVVFTKVDGTRQHLSLIITVIIAGQILTTIQALSAMKQIQVPWPKQLKGLLDVLSLFVFDLEVLALPCILESDNPLSKFVLKLLAYPLFVLLLVVLYLAFKSLNRPLEKLALINANGTFLLAIYISLTLAVALPFQCQSNPSGFLSMATQPGVRCFDDPTHVSLSVLASIGILLYPVGIAAYVAHATVKCRMMAGTTAGVHFARRFQFIFARYKPECYHFGILFLVRNCLVAIIPVVFVTMPVLQINAIALVILLGLVFQVWCQPWRTSLPNRTDTLLGMILVMVVTGVAALMDNTEGGVSTVIGVGMTSAVVIVLVSMLLVLACALHRYFFPTKLYGIFLCHHKAAAGNLCRLLKLILAGKTSHTVFIDSDHLDDLDQLFETVRSSVENLVVVLTSKVLARPWCAGEIVTAHRNGLSMVPLACDDFEPLDEEGVKGLVQSWSEQEMALLGQYGIRPEMVHEAFGALLCKEPMQLQRLLPLRRKEVVMGELMARCQLPLTAGMSMMRIPSKVVKRMSSGSTLTSGEVEAITSSSSAQQGHYEHTNVLVTGLTSDFEALAACEIMQLELQKELETGVSVISDEKQLAGLLPRAEIFLVLWSRGVLQDPSFARVLLSVAEKERPPAYLTAVCDTSFQFPGGDFLEEVERNGIPGLDPASSPALAAIYRTLLKLLSRPFEPQRSQTAITEQVRELAGRARKVLALSRSGTGTLRSTWSQKAEAAKCAGAPKVAPDASPREQLGGSSDEEPPEQPKELPASKDGRDWL